MSRIVERRYVKTQKPNSLLANIQINVDEIYEVRHWAKQLGVSDLQLLSAVAQVGPLVDSVHNYFKDQGAADKASTQMQRFPNMSGNSTITGIRALAKRRRLKPLHNGYMMSSLRASTSKSQTASDSTGRLQSLYGETEASSAKIAWMASVNT